MDAAVGQLVRHAGRAEIGCLALGVEHLFGGDAVHNRIRELVAQRLDLRPGAATGLEPLLELFVGDPSDNALHCGSAQLLLCLAPELRLAEGHLHRSHQPLLDVVLAGVRLAVLVLAGHAGQLAIVLQQDAVDHPGERPVEPCEVRAPRGGGDGVHEGRDFGVVARHPPHGDVNPALPLDLGDPALHWNLLSECLDPVEGDDSGHGTSGGSLLDEVGQAAATHEVERLAAREPGPVVLQCHPQAGHQEAGLAEPSPYFVSVDGGVRVEELFVGEEPHPSAGGLGALAGGSQLASLDEAPVVKMARFLVLEAQLVQVPVALHLHVELGGQGVDDGRAHPVEPPRRLVGALAELAARVQLREDHLESRHVAVGVLVNGDATAVVDDLDGSVAVQRHVHPRGEVGSSLVDGVVDDLPYEVHQPVGAVAADVHGRPLADSFQALERLDGVGVVRAVGSTAGWGYPVISRRPGLCGL